MSEGAVDTICQMMSSDRLTYIGLERCELHDDAMGKLIESVGDAKRLKEVSLWQTDDESDAEQMASVIRACGPRVAVVEMDLQYWNDSQKAMVADVLRDNYSITSGPHSCGKQINSLLARNQQCVENARSAALSVAWISTLVERGCFRLIQRDLVREIAKLVWSTAGEKCWHWE